MAARVTTQSFEQEASFRELAVRPDSSLEKTRLQSELHIYIYIQIDLTNTETYPPAINHALLDNSHLFR